MSNILKKISLMSVLFVNNVIFAPGFYEFQRDLEPYLKSRLLACRVSQILGEPLPHAACEISIINRFLPPEKREKALANIAYPRTPDGAPIKPENSNPVRSLFSQEPVVRKLFRPLPAAPAQITDTPEKPKKVQRNMEILYTADPEFPVNRNLTAEFDDSVPTTISHASSAPRVSFNIVQPLKQSDAPVKAAMPKGLYDDVPAFPVLIEEFNAAASMPTTVSHESSSDTDAANADDTVPTLTAVMDFATDAS